MYHPVYMLTLRSIVDSVSASILDFVLQTHWGLLSLNPTGGTVLICKQFEFEIKSEQSEDY